MNNKQQRSSDALLTEDLKRRLVTARFRALDAVERGDIAHSDRWTFYGLEALMTGRAFSEISLYRAAKSFFNSGRIK